MNIELPRCARCRLPIEVGQEVVYRPDGRVHHFQCGTVLCTVCGGEIHPHEPIRRDGVALTHGRCWMRRLRMLSRRSSA